MLDMFRSVLKGLFFRKLRTLLTMLGVCVGVFSVVVVSSVGQYGSYAVVEELEKMGLSAVTVTVSQEASSFVPLGENELEWIRENAEIQSATPVLMQASKVSNPRFESDAFLLGVDTNAEDIISIQVQYGRMFRNSDISSKSNVCLVDENFAENAYGRANIVGKSISVLCGASTRYFTVIGVVKTGGNLLQNIAGDYIPTFVYLPYTTMQESCGRSEFDQIAVRVRENEYLDSIGEDLLQVLNSKNGFSNSYTVNNLAKQRDGLFSMLNLVVLILTAVGGISLFVASLSIMTIMLVSVSERTKEIGIKKAIGASRSAILFEFLLEAAVISGLGCLLGFGSGYLVIYIAAMILQIPITIQWTFLVGTFLFSLLSGVIFGIYPAIKASALNPVDALRAE